ncbi:MAG TPA: gephyrin-like molybdotransferase Glp [Gemmatimonadaceae bacterium]|nr:gephyrin-like molybdotransferase Glp [Gemmatimonadaceae bacterium]
MAFSVHEASATILGAIRPLGTERIPLGDALRRVLAEDVRSPVELPPWDNSSMDGYAVRASDVASASAEQPVVLPVLETVAAGRRATQPLAPGTAIRIMTGAPVPAGADSVIRVEDTDGGASRVAIRDARDAGRNIRPRGEDIAAGAVAVTAGTLIGPAQLGVLASVGCATPLVHKLPRVAVLVTGDELVDVDGFDAVRRGDRIVSSNSYTLRANAQSAGAEVRYLGIVPDDPDVYERTVRDALGWADLLITSGGVSVGAFDFTKDVLRALGVDMQLWRVRMRPGAPIGFGMLGATAWLGLPGNPVSSMVTFELFARPVIRKLRGERALFRRPVQVRAREELSIAAPLTHFLRGIVEWEHDGAWARLTGPQGSGLLTSMARANALLVVPPERQTVSAGETLSALLLGDDALLSTEFTR